MLPMASAEERRLIAPGTAVGVTEEMIHAVVHAFYGKVREDRTLGPIFDAAVGDWDEHLGKLTDFWSSVMLMTGRFKGAPMAAHAALPDITAAHFAHWLELFAQTAGETCPPAAAALFAARSRMIGRSLQLGLAVHRGE